MRPTTQSGANKKAAALPRSRFPITVGLRKPFAGEAHVVRAAPKGAALLHSAVSIRGTATNSISGMPQAIQRLLGRVA